MKLPTKISVARAAEATGQTVEQLTAWLENWNRLNPWDPIAVTDGAMDYAQFDRAHAKRGASPEWKGLHE